MKRKLRSAAIVAVVLLCGLMMSIAQGVYGEQGLADLVGRFKRPVSVAPLEAQFSVYEAQQIGLDNQSRDLLRQSVVLDGQINALASQKSLIPLKIQQEELLAEFQLQGEYYNVCLLIQNGNLLDQQSNLLDKQIQVEETKLTLGETTQNAVDLLHASREAVLQSCIANQTQINHCKAAIELKIDTSGAYSPDFMIPEFIHESNTMSVTDLQNQLVSNNVSLMEHEEAVSNQVILRDSLKNIGGDNDSYYLEAAAQYDLLIANRETYRSQLLLLVNSKYNEYIAAEAQYTAMIAIRSPLMDQLNILDTMYAQGEISELECLSAKYEVQKNLLEINVAIISKANLLSEIDLLANGVVLATR